MALYNVESPGGYMPTGVTIPGVDILGSKRGYSKDKPWLFDDFDQIIFYEVDEEERERLMRLFWSGRYEYQVEDAVFDLEEHNKLLADTAEEVKKIRAEQRKAQAEMDKLEKELLDKWNKEKEEGKVSMDTVEELLSGKNAFSLFSLKKIPSHLFASSPLQIPTNLPPGADKTFFLHKIPTSSPSKRPSTPMCGKSRCRKATGSRRSRSCPSSRP